MRWAWEGKEETVGALSGSSFPSHIVEDSSNFANHQLTLDTAAPPSTRERGPDVYHPKW